ncbi:MAG: UDP-2,4-diacetamido-2,4,6-trideoxy-beta-L-altropyranose hydrolase, partial [Proteobacteria bacterium]|nr:UDP-2,4-diacetamido-2,4,6-trideoxy-beta-L-altropyranose hydrolase [Pseudomonadota bacterium]
DPSALFAAADLVIGTPGVTTLELCVLGVPMILLVLRDIQTELGEALTGRGCARVFTLDSGAADAIARALGELAQPGVLGAMSAAAAATTDGRGAVRIAEGLAAIWREAA